MLFGKQEGAAGICGISTKGLLLAPVNKPHLSGEPWNIYILNWATFPLSLSSYLVFGRQVASLDKGTLSASLSCSWPCLWTWPMATWASANESACIRAAAALNFVTAPASAKVPAVAHCWRYSGRWIKTLSMISEKSAQIGEEMPEEFNRMQRPFYYDWHGVKYVDGSICSN